MATTYSGYQGYPPSSESAVNVVPIVGLWRRFFAVFIDGIVLGLIGCLTGGIFGAGAGILMAMADTDADMASLAINPMGNCIGLVVGAVYHIAFWSTTGQTLGKMAMGLRIVTEAGEKPSLSVATVRYVMYFLGGLILNIGFAIAAFDSKNRHCMTKLPRRMSFPALPKSP